MTGPSDVNDAPGADPATERRVIRLPRSAPVTARAGSARLASEFETRQIVSGAKPGSPYVRLTWRYGKSFRRAGAGRLIATEELLRPRGAFARGLAVVRRFALGAPLSTDRLEHERLSKFKALAVFSSDAISSSAYATEEILLALLLAGSGVLEHAIPIALGIAALLAVVIFSYRQTVRAYPNGGGSYIVARENLGVMPGLVAASALMLDYVLTVAVSIAAGVAAILSAVPGLEAWRVELSLLFVALIALGNLRGIRESGSIFAAPTYLFILSFGSMIVVGLVKLAFAAFSGASLTSALPPQTIAEAQQPLTLFLLLRAFSSGSAALTGVEAISNGVPAFKPNESKNAATTLLWMGVTLGFFFLGVTFLANRLGIVPAGDQTVISQIAHAVFGSSFFYYAVQSTTAMILVLAANTSFADFPRLASILAHDGFLPHQFTFRGERLAFSNGIVVLGLLAALLIVVFGGQTHRLIPLYAVGVFLAFTLSQSGMVVRWWRNRARGWQRGLAINGVGAVATGVVLLVIIATKFTHGAWMVVALIPVLVASFAAVSRHYQHVADQLVIPPLPEAVERPRIGRVVVPVGGVNLATARTISYARSLSDDVTAVHVADDTDDGSARFREEWQRHIGDCPLVVIDSPYRSFTEPLIAYLDAVDQGDPERPLTVVIPEFTPRRWWQFLLHNQTSLRLKAYLLFRPNTIVISAPQVLDR